MKPLLKISIVIAILAGSFLLLDHVYTFCLSRNVDLKASYVLKEKVDADILFHGPCEPLWMVSPAQIDKITGLKSYNLALSHSDFADNYLHLYLYLRNNKAPRYLFLYVTPESMDSMYNTFNTYRFAPYMDDPEVSAVVRECDERYWRWSRFPFMRYAYYNSKINFSVVQGLKHYLSGRRIPYFADGYEPPHQVKWDNHSEKFRLLYPHGYMFRWDPLREKYLVKTIGLAKQYGIKVILYESPVLEESLQWQPNRKEIVRRIKDLAMANGVQYKQFENMLMARSRNYYMSPLNTNIAGSGIFNDTLGAYINSIK